MKLAPGICLVFCVVCAAKLAAQTVDLFYIGTWKFSGAVAAPWADPKQKPDGADKARLLGKTVVVSAKRITGPTPIACAMPHYKISDYPPDMVFHGAFAEMQSKDSTVDPSSIAGSLGFSGARIRTLETGCEIDLHFVDATTAEIAVNETIYTLKKQ
ncbi:hypothetical protein [Bradyrhizobium sp.]|uniref:hypothetical protein n=1 Tax=Bradyrhizobium sp. TaxID=376 RepID=UPI003C58B779